MIDTRTEFALLGKSAMQGYAVGLCDEVSVSRTKVELRSFPADGDLDCVIAVMEDSDGILFMNGFRLMAPDSNVTIPVQSCRELQDLFATLTPVQILGWMARIKHGDFGRKGEAQ